MHDASGNNANAEHAPLDERLARWPWGVRQLFQAPNAQLIEKHATLHLYRALSIGRVTAFIGSGASMAYGRIGWVDLIASISERAIKEYNDHQSELNARGGHNDKPDGETPLPLRRRIHDLLEKHSRTGLDERKAVDQLVVFQLAEDLTRVLDAERLGEGPRLRFREQAMQWVQDAGGHAELLFEYLFDNDARLNKCRDLLEKRMTQTLKEGYPRWSRTTLEGLAGDYRLNIEEDFRPSRLHRLVAALHQLDGADASETLVRDLDALFKPQQGAALREVRVKPSRDPLLMVLEDLSINRFLTTNYDHEIEQLFEDCRYCHDVPAGAQHDSGAAADRDPLRATWRDIVFSYEKAGDLGALASRDRRPDGWVVHLHGRAGQGEGAGIIATEQDYRERYARLDKSRIVVDDAIRVAFGASPLLFLGIGFDEVDLLRPLRQFMSEPGRMGDRLAIALLPRRKDANSIELDKIDLLQRYGIYAIHYGTATFRSSTADAGSDDWLYKLFQVSQAVKTMLREQGTESVARERTADTARNALRQLQSLDEFVAGLSVPEALDGQSVSADTCFENDLEDIKLAAQFCLETEALTRPEERPDWLSRHCRGHRVRASGAFTSVQTAALCSALQHLRKGLRVWANERMALPTPRIIKDTPGKWCSIREVEQRLEGISESNEGQPFRRHSVDLPSPGDVNWFMRFYSGAASQTFNWLRLAMDESRELIKKQPQSRMRVFLMLAPRGVGRGHFFSALGGRRFPQFLRMIYANDQDVLVRHTFLNLSFSVEVASVFDRLADFLWTSAVSEPTPEQSLKNRHWESLERDRIARLRFALEECKNISTRQPFKRLVVAISGINILFDRSGRPKNRQVGALFDLLLAEKDLSADVPIDYVLVCSDNAVPAYFREIASQDGAMKPACKELVMLHLLSGHIQKDNRLDLERYAADLRLSVRRSTFAHTYPGHYVHILRHARASVLVIAFFPAVALVVASRALKADRAGASGGGVTLSGLKAQQAALAEFFKRDQEDLDSWIVGAHQQGFPLLLWAAYQLAQNGGFAAVLDRASHARADRERPASLPKGRLTEQEAQLFVQMRQSAPKTNIEDSRTEAFRNQDIRDENDLIKDERLLLRQMRCQKHLQRLTDQIDLSLASYGHPSAFDGQLKRRESECRKIDETLRDLSKSVGNNRFALTLLFALINEVIGGGDHSGEGDFDVSEDRCAEAWDVVQEIRDVTAAVPSRRRAERVVTAVLAVIRRRHELYKPLPAAAMAGIGAAAIDGEDPLSRSYQDLVKSLTPQRGMGIDLFEIQEWILWHLAVTSLPVDVAVLASCPLIRRGVSNLLRARASADIPAAEPSAALAEAVVEDSLKILMSRCLVFRLERTAFKTAGELHRGPVRYSIHRLVQRHVLKRVGSDYFSYPDDDRLSLTLYPSQPNGTPHLSIEAHEHLRLTAFALSLHPEGVHLATSAERLNGERDLRSRKLRAAYGIVRFIYSVATVAHFDAGHKRLGVSYQGVGSLMSPGFFEEHRRLLFWLLEEAKALEQEARKAKGAGKTTEENYPPFYAEDIVWLYNETGVLSLAQGAVPDALFLFKMADEAADRYLENDELGPLRALILLNRAIADIERGHLKSAESDLTRIIERLETQPLREDREVLLIATGYRGLVQHLTGYVDLAEESYEKAVHGLTRLHSSRAASILARHHASMLLKIGKFDKARALLRSAVQLSTDDDHEDARHHALLAEARLKVIDEGPLSPEHTPRSIHADLDGVEQYARMMGMARLASEVDEVRARLHLRNGDLQSAGTAAMNSLEVASINELRIQKALVLLLLAEINLKRDHFPACRAFLEEAMTLSRLIDYHPGLIDAQAITDRLRAQDLSGALSTKS